MSVLTISDNRFVASTLDALLTSTVRHDGIPGIALAIGTRDGVVYTGAAGRRSVDGGAAFTPDTVLWLGSLTELVTVIVALQLVERGVIGLEDPAGDHLPEIDLVPVLDVAGPGDATRTRERRARVTVRHLITHTAGGRAHRPGDQPAAVLTAAPDALLRTPWQHEPGTVFGHGVGIGWLGLLVEAVTGSDLATRVREEVLEPLAIHDVFAGRPADARERSAPVHLRRPGGTVEPVHPSTDPGSVRFSGSDGLHGTVGGYLTILRALLHGGALEGVRILRAETVAAGLRDQVGGGATGAGRVAGTGPRGRVPTWGWFGAVDGATVTFRVGVGNAYWWIDTRRGVTGVVAAPLLPAGDAGVLALQSAAGAIAGAQARLAVA